MQNFFYGKTAHISDVRIYSTVTDEELMEILDFINNTKIQNIEDNPKFQLLGEGAFGKVFKYKNYALKLFFDASEEMEINEDARNLFQLRGIDLYPKFYAKHNFFMISEYIDGKLFIDLKKEDYEVVNDNTIKSLLEGIKKTLILDIEPSDLSNENLILSKDGQIKIVDVGNFKFFDDNRYNRIMSEKDIDKRNLLLDNYIKQWFLNRVKIQINEIESRINETLELTA